MRRLKSLAINLLLLSSVSFMISGCSVKVASTYKPSSAMTVKGSMKVGTFRYLQAEKDNELALNQIKENGFGDIFLDKNINTLFEEALFTEARFVGINLENSKNIITGEIIELNEDYVNWNILKVTWDLTVNYIVKKDNKICFSKMKTVHWDTTKTSLQQDMVANVIKQNIEKLFSDEEFVNCLK
jgi:uncharacterized lipoprotein